MKVLVDIGHPAHVHYFRNVMIRMTQDGHTFKVIVRNKEVSQQLLQAYGISYTSRGKGATSRLGKFLYMVKADIQVFFIALRFRPDVFLSGASPYAAHVSWLLRKPHVALDDTEHAVFARKFYLPFTSKVITPFCYQLDLGNKQVRMNSFLELFYLHPKYRTESTTIRQKLGVTSNEPFALLRFVSWGASHDYGVKGIDLDTKLQVIRLLERTHKILISAEGELPNNLERYRIKVLPHEMHKVLAEADLYIGEGATMASECAMLGTPAIYINKLEVSYVTEESKHLSIVHTRNATELLDALNRMLADGNGKQHAREKLASYIQMLDDPNPILIEQLELVHKGKG
jgi:predicted glycosyltransferase